MKTLLHTPILHASLFLFLTNSLSAQTTAKNETTFFDNVQHLLIDSTGDIRLQKKLNALLKSDDTLHSNLQVSFFPPLSTNGKQAGNTINVVSLNILGGYSHGTTAAEIGGLFNLDKGSVRYVQAAGLLNLTGGSVKGAQVAGMMNKSWLSVTGAQAAGLMNMTKKEVLGAQVAGMMNYSGGNVTGAQAAGLMNISDSLHGAQIAGMMNLANQHVLGSQVAGLLNVSVKNVKGTQVAGIWNQSDTVRGAQISGLGNSATYVEGAQISGFLNRAKVVKGCQIGIINISDTCKGTPIGIFSYSKQGYHKLEVSGDELIYTQVGFRTGVERFQNIFFAGIDPTKRDYTLWTFGFGVGSKLPLTDRWAISADLTSQQLIKNDNFQSLAFLNKCFIAAEFQVAPKFSIAVGPTLNVYICDTQDKDYNSVFKDLAPYSFFNRTIDNDHALKMWVGGKIALRFF